MKLGKSKRKRTAGADDAKPSRLAGLLLRARAALARLRSGGKKARVAADSEGVVQEGKAPPDDAKPPPPSQTSSPPPSPPSSPSERSAVWAEGAPAASDLRGSRSGGGGVGGGGAADARRGLR